ncbi:hypothetical protein [Lacticaseibacillus paracasei]|uniref:hypothetical protein n=1 Tax=Lacticaseibacillus paracasei TaxID=1597 RepID=UPI000F43945A|nr:hypothetical protein [Lacticaseibacillus paracasei]RND41236.1 hypothetical protein FAM10859_00657 [Lacticaseibacillus paracasei]
MEYPLYNPSVLDQFVEDTAEHFTDDPSDAMYLFPDGRMTSSTFAGIRGDDHNVLTTYFDLLNRPGIITLKLSDTDAYNNIVTQALGAITVVPESQTFLKGSNQEITDKQQMVMAASDFSVEDYVKNQPLNAEYLEARRLDRGLLEPHEALNSVKSSPKEQLTEIDELTDESKEDFANHNLIVKADNFVDAAQKLFKNDLAYAVEEAFTLNDVANEIEAKEIRNNGSWQAVAHIEAENKALISLGDGYYTEAYIARDDQSPYAANKTFIQQNNLTDHTSNPLRRLSDDDLAHQFKNKLDQVAQLEKDIAKVRQEIHARTLQNENDYEEKHPDQTANPDQPEERSFHL